MKSKNMETLIRKNIRSLKPYSSARSEYKGRSGVFLDANENSLGSPGDLKANRYPDPLQLKLKKKIAEMKNVGVKNIFLGNGSDEAIDILLRVFCEPGIDNIIVCPPTYGMYEVLADINDIEVKKVNLFPESFDLNMPEIFKAVNKKTKMIFICSPNNPTGNVVKQENLEFVLNNFSGLVIVDEAYIDFAAGKGSLSLLEKFDNLVVLQTFSKAWGLAGLRVGLAYASETVIGVMNKIKSPYNIGSLTQEMVLKVLENVTEVNRSIAELIRLRKNLCNALKMLECVETVYPSETNFLLVKFYNAKDVFEYLIDNKIIIRDRSNQPLCENCLRITVGTEVENIKLINCLNKY